MIVPPPWNSRSKATVWNGSAQWRILVTVTLLAALTWIGWRTFDSNGTDRVGPASIPDSSQGQPTVETREQVELTPDPTISALGEVPDQEIEETRTALLASGTVLLQGTVSSSSDGTGIAGATVTWTSWSEHFLTASLASVEIPPADLEARTRTTQTDERGIYRFEHLPPEAQDQISVLWVTDPTHAAQSRQLDPGEGTKAGVIDFELTEVSPVQVQVLENGQPAEQAEVFQEIAYPLGTPASYNNGGDLPKDLLLFERRYTWHPGNALSIAPLGKEEGETLWPKEHKLWAQSPENLSNSYRGVNQALIRLSLQPTFSVSGVVLPPAPESMGPAEWTDGEWGQARVVIYAWQGPLQTELGSLLPDSDGRFGSQALPWLEAERFAAALLGNRFIRHPVEFAPPQQGDEVSLQLEARIGNVHWLQALDPQGTPIPFPWATIRWFENDQPEEHIFKGRADGYIAIPGVPDGIMTGTVSARGFSTEGMPELLSPASFVTAGLVQLTPALTLTGRCMRGSEPVRDFEVRYWNLQEIRARGSIRVCDSADGRFELSNPPSGDLVLSAIADDYSTSPEIVLAASDPGREEEIVLSVSPPGALVGRLVDAGTRTALAEGSVTLYTTHSFSEMDPIGPITRAAPDGSIRVQRLPEGLSIVSFSAPSHSTRELKVWYDGKKEVELGDIELDPTQPLHATVLCPDGQDPTRLVMTSEGIGSILPTHFDAQGEILIPQANAGAFWFRVSDQDAVGFGLPLINQETWLRTGETWNLRFDLRTGNVITVLLSSRDEAGELLVANARSQDPKGNTTWQTVPFDESGQAQLHAIPSGSIVLTVESPRDGTVLGTEIVSVPPDLKQPLAVEIDLDRSPVTVRVVNPKGIPQQEVYVEVGSLEGNGPSLTSSITDGDGYCDLGPLPPEADRVTLFGPEAGVNEQLPLALPSRPDEVVELVFDLSASLRLHITDEGVPQPTATVRLWNPERPDRILTPGRLPDAGGILVLPRLGPGPYELRVSASNLWPVRMLVEATHENLVQEVSIRRLGGLDVTFIDDQGSLQSGETIELEFLPSQESVRDWMTQGKLKAPFNTLQTDSAGRLQMDRIPHGTYRWTLKDQQGVIEVPIENTFRGIVEVH